jgi:hypothetical protein
MAGVRTHNPGGVFRKTPPEPIDRPLSHLKPRTYINAKFYTQHGAILPPFTCHICRASVCLHRIRGYLVNLLFSIFFGLNPDQPVKVQPSVAQMHPILSDLARTRTLLHVTLTRPFAVYTARSEHFFLDYAFKFLLPNTRCVGTYH